MSVSNEFHYKAKVTRHNGWQNYTTARFGISVGMPYHEGDKLRAALDWAIPRFKKIEVRVSDTLQRYNMPGNPDDNKDLARAAGDAWIERNRSTLNRVPHLFLFRWDDILEDLRYPGYYQEVEKRILKDTDFNEAIRDDAEEYSRRTHREISICISFLKEELAAFSLLQDKSPAAEVYPGSFLKSRMLLRPDFNMTRIDFLRVRIPPPLQLPLPTPSHTIRQDPINRCK